MRLEACPGAQQLRRSCVPQLLAPWGEGRGGGREGKGRGGGRGKGREGEGRGGEGRRGEGERQIYSRDAWCRVVCASHICILVNGQSTCCHLENTSHCNKDHVLVGGREGEGGGGGGEGEG